MVKDQFGVDMTFAPAAGRPQEARKALEEQVFNVIEKLYRAKEEELGVDPEGVPVLRRWDARPRPIAARRPPARRGPRFGVPRHPRWLIGPCLTAGR